MFDHLIKAHKTPNEPHEMPDDALNFTRTPEPSGPAPENGAAVEGPEADRHGAEFPETNGPAPAEVRDVPESPHPPACDALHAVLADVAAKDPSQLTPEELIRLRNEIDRAYKERCALDRRQVFQEMTTRLLETDILRTFQEGEEAERKDALRDLRDFLGSIGLKASLEAIEKLTRSPEKRGRPRKVSS